MKYEKGKNGSYIHNSIIIKREDDPSPSSFSPVGDVFVRLNGYAVIPIKEYARLIKIESLWTGDPKIKLIEVPTDDIKQADLELWGSK